VPDRRKGDTVMAYPHNFEELRERHDLLIETYQSRLLGDDDLAERNHTMLVAAHAEHGLYMRDRMLCNVLQPRFLLEADAETMATIASQLAAMFERIGAVLLNDDAMLDRVGATQQERDLWRIDPGYPGFTLTSRLDSFVCDDGPKFVEYNAESPASIGYCDLLSEIFYTLPAMTPPAAHFTDYELERFYAREALLETLLWAYKEWGGNGSPAIAIIDWDDVVTKRDFELCCSFFTEHGLQATITDPRAFTYRDGRLWSGDMSVDLVYRRVLLHELLARADEAGDLLQAYADGAICMVNSPRSKLLHKKAVMALLSDPDSGMPLSVAERKLVAQTIPWTRLLEQGETTFGEQRVDLEMFVCENRERMALKPSDEYGGKGVVLGWETSQHDWNDAVHGSMNRQFVVQERVPVPEMPFAHWGDNGLEIVPMLVDTNPLMFRGTMRGILTRISNSALLNVTAGTGSTTPTYIVRNREIG